MLLIANRFEDFSRAKKRVEQLFVESKASHRGHLAVAQRVRDQLNRARNELPIDALIVELVTNAAKHAFPGGNDGLVRIDLLYREGRWRCTVSDNGIGVAGPLRGSGARILEDLARSIRARTITAFGCRGTTVTVVLPN